MDIKWVLECRETSSTHHLSPRIYLHPSTISPALYLFHIASTTMSSIALARVYQQSFESHPYGTLALTNGALNALGDVVAHMTQNLVRTLTASRTLHSNSP